MILGAISIPNLLRARQSAYEASAAGFLHTVQTEQIAYRTGRVKLNPPLDSSDPAVKMMIVASEMFVSQDPSPGGNVLLYLNPIALVANDQRLLLMGQENEPSPGFLVVIYDGEYYSYSITPIASDGSLGGQSVRVVWSVEQHAYVLG